MEFVDINKLCPRILLDICYASTNNFLKKQIYPLAKCFLRKKVADRLLEVQFFLEKQKLGLKVFDGYRPLSVQKIFWGFLPDERYVANPKTGSKHNRGASVDVTLVDVDGSELAMPTEFDDFSEKAGSHYPHLPPEKIKNRTILQDAMQRFGFLGIDSEWWHYDDKDWQTYPIEDLSLEELSRAIQ